MFKYPHTAPTPRRAAARLLAAFTLTLFPTILMATSLNPLTDTELVRKADLIFQGVVTRVDYRMSTILTTGDVQLPHTFVTFHVERVLKGKYSGTSSQFTLRLTGGSNPIAKRFMRLEGCPDFDIGERVVLFVRQNQHALCPLAGWAQGRFRIVNDAVFSDSGREVWLTAQSTLVLGPRRALAEVRTHHRGGGIYAYRVASSDVSETSVTLPPMTGTRLTLSTFISYVSWRVKTSHTTSELSLLPPVTSANSEQQFRVARFLTAVGGL